MVDGFWEGDMLVFGISDGNKLGICDGICDGIWDGIWDGIVVDGI
jgi:hypothetical protein